MVKRPANQKQKGIPYGVVGVRGEERHCGGGFDKKRGEELTREVRSASVSTLEGAWLLKDRGGKGDNVTGKEVGNTAGK